MMNSRFESEQMPYKGVVARSNPDLMNARMSDLQNERRREMEFQFDPKHKDRVFDIEKKAILTRIFRDVPQGERWFRFEFNGVDFSIVSKFDSCENDRCWTFSINIEEAWKNFNTTLVFTRPKYAPNFDEFKSVVLPSLKEGITFLQNRLARSTDPAQRWKVNVELFNK